MALEKGATEVIAVYLDAVGRFRPSELTEVPNLTFIESKWNLGDFLVFDTANAKRILRIGYLDAMKTFGVFDGGYYTFAKGAFDRKTLRQADCAARIFDLDPLTLYRRRHFSEALAAAVTRARAEEPLSLDAVDLSGISKAADSLKAAGKKAAALFIADSLREKSETSIFLSKYAPRLLKEKWPRQNSWPGGNYKRQKLCGPFGPSAQLCWYSWAGFTETPPY